METTCARLAPLAQRTFPRVYWSVTPASLDLAHPAQRSWWVRQVLLRGNDEEIRALPDDVIREAVAERRLPPSLQALWEDHLAGRPCA